MPGTRLSRSEREQISAGLIAGLDYAEIARSTGRPTSTITREVARNGGPSGYSADAAVAAARARATRPRGRAGHIAAADPAAEDLDPAVRDFVDEFVAMVAATGLPPMAARVLVQVYLADTGCTAVELSRQLGVSKAAVSKAVSYLDGLGLLRRERDPGTRRERYIIGDDIWATAWQVSVRTNARWAATAARGVGVVGPDTPAGIRLADAARFFTGLYDLLVSGPAPVVPAEAAAMLRTLAGSGVPLTAAQIHHALTPTQRRALDPATASPRHPRRRRLIL